MWNLDPATHVALKEHLVGRVILHGGSHDCEPLQWTRKNAYVFFFNSFVLVKECTYMLVCYRKCARVW